MWDAAATGKCVQTLAGHTSTVISVAMDGGLIVTGSVGKTAKVRDAATGKCVQTLAGHTGIVIAVAMSGDQIVTGCGDKTAKVWGMVSFI